MVFRAGSKYFISHSNQIIRVLNAVELALDTGI